ncbi:MAG: type VI secretion protein IcmF/TssM N-terminal domain-containing protein [Gemmataceae bacterium]
MNTLMTLFLSFLGWVRNLILDLVGLIMPLFATERLERMAAALWFTLHILAVLGIAALLYWLDGYWKLYTYIRVINAPPAVARAWLSILWLLVYAVFILCYVLYRLLISEQTTQYFPDIDRAWTAAMEAMRKQNLEIQRLPMFLVLGRAEAGDDVLFPAAGMPLELRQSPPGDHPVHVYATAKAVFVTCPGASVLGSLSAWLHGDAAVAAPAGAEDDGAGATLRPGQGVGGGGGQSADMAAILARGGNNPANLGPVDRRELRRLDRKDNRQKAAARTPEAIEQETARLRYLCGLMSRDRSPLCAINGVLVLVPFAGLDSEQDAAFVADACDRDLKAVRAGTGQHCQVLALLCDMESAPGFTELVSRFPENQRRSRVGQGMALVAGFKEARGEGGPAANTLSSLARWVAGGVMRYWVLTKCQLERNVGTVVPEGFDLNTHLFALLHEMSDRQTHLATVLGRGFSGYAPADQLLFGGCYLAATGRAPAQQAFVSDVFDKLLKGEEHVFWTDEVMNDEYRLNGWINFGWLVLALAAVAAALVAGYLVDYRK